MNPYKIIGKIGKYLTVVVLTILAGNFAMNCLTERDTFANLGGVLVWFLVLSAWIIILWDEFFPKKNTQSNNVQSDE